MNARTAPAPVVRRRPTQAERSAQTRSALLESAARGLSRHGYGNLVLEQVAREAGYTRGALYHQFKDKEDLALAVLQWVDETWWREVGGLAEHQPDAATALIALARGHAVYCRRDVARVMMALRIEFSGQDYPVGREIEADLRETGEALRRPNRRWPWTGRFIRASRGGGRACVCWSDRGRCDRARRACAERRAAGRPRGCGRARAGWSANASTWLIEMHRHFIGRAGCRAASAPGRDVCGRSLDRVIELLPPDIIWHEPTSAGERTLKLIAD